MVLMMLEGVWLRLSVVRLYIAVTKFFFKKKMSCKYESWTIHTYSKRLYHFHQEILNDIK